MKTKNLIKLGLLTLTIVTLVLLAIGDTRAVVKDDDKEATPKPVYEDISERLMPGEPTVQQDRLKGIKAAEYALGELIVKLKDGKTLADIQELNAKYGVSVTNQVFQGVASPRAKVEELKKKLTQLNTQHDKWYWQLDKSSQEYKDYIARIEKERTELKSQIQTQEELNARLEERQKRALCGEALRYAAALHSCERVFKDTN